MSTTPPVPKAKEDDILGRFREIVSDPINLLIRRAPRSTPALWWILPLLGGIAAYLALQNPA